MQEGLKNRWWEDGVTLDKWRRFALLELVGLVYLVAILLLK